MSELIEKWNKQRTEKILRTGETFSESYIYCPYCGYEQQDTFEWDLTPNDEEFKKYNANNIHMKEFHRILETEFEE